MIKLTHRALLEKGLFQNDLTKVSLSTQSCFGSISVHFFVKSLQPKKYFLAFVALCLVWVVKVGKQLIRKKVGISRMDICVYQSVM